MPGNGSGRQPFTSTGITKGSAKEQCSRIPHRCPTTVHSAIHDTGRITPGGRSVNPDRGAFPNLGRRNPGSCSWTGAPALARGWSRRTSQGFPRRGRVNTSSGPTGIPRHGTISRPGDGSHTHPLARTRPASHTQRRRRRRTRRGPASGRASHGPHGGVEGHRSGRGRTAYQDSETDPLEGPGENERGRPSRGREGRPRRANRRPHEGPRRTT